MAFTLTRAAFGYTIAALEMTDSYDVIIVGGGPAGIFAALELVEQNDLCILLIEKGRDIDQRLCPVRDSGGACVSCSPCNLVCGLGGAGAFSDGKLTLSSKVGGHLGEYLADSEVVALVKHVDGIYRRFGAPDKLYGVGEEVVELGRRASLSALRLIPVPVRHLGTENCCSILKAVRDYLVPRVEFRLELAATRIITDNGEARGIETSSGERFGCRYLVLAPGREGADWLSAEAKRLKLAMLNNPVDVGLRVELPAAIMAPITKALYEVKLQYVSKRFDDSIRTFCMCPSGEVIMESTGGADPVVTVNGHSYANRQTENTNFALLMSTTFTEPFHEPIAYGKYLARLANILSGGVLVQRLGDLLEGRRSTPARIERGLVKPTLKSATPGDLSFVLPYRHLTGIIEMLKAMDQMAPGVASRHTLLYGVEVKFYSFRPQLKPTMETEITNLFACGDGAGISRGLIEASASGVVAAREIINRNEHK
jgi:uncharacterized FAD-dependent dehydrogenase